MATQCRVVLRRGAGSARLGRRQSLTIERRFAGSAGEQEGSAAAELVAWRSHVIVAMGGIDARPVLALSRAIPIVIVTVYDPVGQGFAASLARPGGNVTGTTAFTTELVPKLLELVHDLISAPGRVSILGNPQNPGNVELPSSVGDALGKTIVSRHATRPDELDTAFAAAAVDGDQAIVVQFSALTLEEEMARHRARRPLPIAGGL
jgi:putative ABC transport system substrate-binding protein